MARTWVKAKGEVKANAQLEETVKVHVMLEVEVQVKG